MGNRLKIGIFGAWRGTSYINILKDFSDAYVYAICDKDEEKLNSAKANCEPDVKIYNNPDEFFDCGMDAVILCNYFHEHASYAIKAMKKGIHVLSETTSASTLKECVNLCRTVESTGCTYALAENYPYMLPNLELERLYKGGTLGKVLYAEGEYVHPCSIDDLKYLSPNPLHWRAWCPRTYYLTHSLAPLMMMTDTMPKAVNAKSVHSEVFEENLVKPGIRQVSDAVSIMLVQMDNGALFRITACAAFAPHGNWYRLACECGGAENVRGNNEKVRLEYNGWCKPEGAELSKIYTPEWPSNKELAEKAGHGGGDFWVVYNFIQSLKNGTQPYFDVYRGATMSAVGILGWRSSMEHGKEYIIPDFRNEEERSVYANDDLSPFPDENGKATLPCTSKVIK